MNWWEELELETETEKRLQAEIERLKAINAELLAACELTLITILRNDTLGEIALYKQIQQAIADAKGQPNQPTGPKLPGLE